MPRLPNILWVLTTQWRAQACGYAGDRNARTPHLDALAFGAANFRQAVTPHPFGPFARAAILTGLPSPANGVRDYFDPLPAGARTIAHDLNDRGYTTAFFGKWHLAPRDPTVPLVGEAHARTVVPEELRGGFDFWEGFEGGFQLNDPWLHGTRRPSPTRVAGYQSDVVCESAQEWIGEQGLAGREPWFCIVSLEAPHPPYAAPAPGITPVDPATLKLASNVPRGGEVEQKARAELAGYYAHITATDRAIGQLLAGLDRQGTAVVFTSVHGDMHGAHGLFRKGWPHEESIRVPLLVRVPDHFDPVWSGFRNELVSLLDLRDWALRWADGVVAPPLASATQQISMPSVVALPHQCDRAWRAVRTPYRKLVLAEHAGGASNAPWLYFDLEHDPDEMSNLAADPARRTEIEALRSLIRLPAPDAP